MAALFDALAFSGLWVATAAAALVAASTRVFGSQWSPALLGFAFGGTFCIYALDRLRDLPRDRVTAPLRSAFVERHRAALIGASIAAALVGAACTLHLGAAAVAAAALAGGLGLFHRRLKHVPFVKGLYVAASWVAVTIALPALLARPRPPAAIVAWTAAVIGAALLANAIATSVRDEEAAAAVLGARRALGVALGIALAGAATAFAAPAPVRGLAPVPVLTALALAVFPRDERYEIFLDGALAIGALWVLL